MSQAQSVFVLAVPHQFQGRNFNGYVKDAGYEKLLENLLAHSVDFIFEEAAGRSPSIAEDIANSRTLGYCDIDPTSAERPQYGIPESTESWNPIDPWNTSLGMCSQLDISAQRKREEVWLQRIQGHTFKVGLVICGTAHAVSFTLRLRCAGFCDVELYNYNGK